MARIFLERREWNDEVGSLFNDLVSEAVSAGAAGEYAPPVDVLETDAGLEIIVDLAGVEADAISVVAAQDTLIIAGHKRPPACQHHAAAFHLVERAFGRFARGVPLSGAYDIAHADATLRAGELRILLPRLEERRGREIRIHVRTD
ncbi:MAG: Hsp20/alpha crystallin family protein [Acidobacteriota bacterium]